MASYKNFSCNLFKTFISNNITSRKTFVWNCVRSAQISTTQFKSKPPSLFLLTAVGVGAGAVLGGGYSFYVVQKANIPVFYDGSSSSSPLIKTFPDVSISRRVSSIILSNFEARA